MRMKKVLLIIGIVLIAVGVLSLAYGALNMFGYYHVLDGSTELYHRLHQKGIIFTVTGIVLVLIAIACLIIRSRIKA